MHVAWTGINKNKGRFNPWVFVGLFTAVVQRPTKAQLLCRGRRRPTGRNVPRFFTPLHATCIAIAHKSSIFDLYVHAFLIIDVAMSLYSINNNTITLRTQGGSYT